VKPKVSGSVLFLVGMAALALALVVFRSASVEIAYPGERAKRTFCDRVWSRVTGFFRASKANAENVRLRREVASLAILRLDIERLESENDRLRKALDYSTRIGKKWVAAPVLSQGGAAAGVRRLLRSGRGTLDGVKVGAIVIAPEGLVGRVTAVTPHTAEICLVTDDLLKVACEIESANKLSPRGILCGGDDECLILRYLTNVTDVPPRSRVFTSGLGGVFPRGLEIGTLIDFRRDAQGLVYQGEVQPSVDYSALEDVFISCER